MKLRCLPFIMVVCSLCTVSHCNEKSTDNQYMHTQEGCLPEVFFEPLEYTRSSIGHFLEHTYNHPLYGPQFLAFNFFHIAEFLKHAHKTKQPRRYISKTLQRFTFKEQSLIYINSTAFFELLEQLPEFLKPYFDKDKEKTEILSDIKLCAYNFLLQDFKYLKDDPEGALDKFSASLYELTSNRDRNKKYDLSIKRLQSHLSEFLKTSLSKLIWSAKDQEWSWNLTKSFSQKLLELQQQNSITAKQLDELIWILLYRYCYFLELEGEKLSAEFFALARKDLSTELPLWSLKERNPYGVTKLRYLQQALMEAEIYAQAYGAGLVARKA